MSAILTIAANLNTQDNRITSDPIFVVQQKVRRPVPEGYSEEGEWYDSDHCETVTDHDELLKIDAQEKAGDLDTRYRWVWYVDDWVFVQPFFTEAGAQAYLRINGHNLREPRIYVESGYRNEEWQTVRKHLMEQGPTEWKS